MTSDKLSTQPYKGARDFYPEEMKIRNYMFGIMKSVAERYGFVEYDFPILEPFEIFAAKTGEEIVNNQLFNFEDQGKRRLAIRPELTPGTVRMIAQKYSELPKPIKWFMIGNNWRYERPQLGRGREFYQLELNIFGVENVTADFEIFQVMKAIMQEFGATEEQFEVLYSDRRIIRALLLETLQLDEEIANATRRLMDKRNKISKEVFYIELEKVGLTTNQIDKVEAFMGATMASLRKIIPSEILENNVGFQALEKLNSLLEQADIAKYCRFDPSIIRGFDYSDGLVYEVFDKNPNNNRSLFGGERFNKLVEIFGKYDLPATGFGMGDWTLLEFLKNWDLLPKLESTTEYFVTVWPDEDPKYFLTSMEVAEALRNIGKNTTLWLETDSQLDKQLKYADKNNVNFAVIIGTDEINDKTVTVKDLKQRAQKTLPFEQFLSEIE